MGFQSYLSGIESIDEHDAGESSEGFQSYLSGIERINILWNTKREALFQSYLSGIESRQLKDGTYPVQSSNRTLVELKVGQRTILLLRRLFQSYLSGIESWSKDYFTTATPVPIVP